MPRPPSPPMRPLPGWVIWIGSAVIGFHLFAILMHVLAASSGPWVTPMGDSQDAGPMFARTPDEVLGPKYLVPLKMSSDYHFAGNRPEAFGVKFEVVLRDNQGKEVTRLKFPEEGANFWVRHRQARLASRLLADSPVPPPEGEAISAPKQKPPTISIWEQIGDGSAMEVARFRLKTTPEHLIKRDRPVYRPSELSIVLARSYMRYLCRKHGAASAELIRHSRMPILSAAVLTDPLPPNTIADMIASYEYRVEN